MIFLKDSGGSVGTLSGATTFPLAERGRKNCSTRTGPLREQVKIKRGQEKACVSSSLHVFPDSEGDRALSVPSPHHGVYELLPQPSTMGNTQALPTSLAASTNKVLLKAEFSMNFPRRLLRSLS